MDAVEEIKSRLSIEDVIGKYVELKRAGRNFRGLSPFGNEKTPSFMVSPEKQIWHDFSSGKGGNIFSFIMEMEGLDFKGALEHLARLAGVDLAKYRTGQSGEFGQQKERVLAALELAAKFYQVHFSKNRTALEYILGKRAFTKATALEFQIGYSPSQGSALASFMLKKGFSEKEINAAGLGSRRGGSFRDMFRGRVMFPLCDPQGRVIGFTARILEDDPNAPKYINTPQTIVYDKSRHVYGLHLAKEAIRAKNHAVIVEGNLDVIASHQVGVKHVVATAGTAITANHLKAISRFVSDIRLAFDQDKAGIAAAERAIAVASGVGVTLGIIDIPDGKDPDELIKLDPAAWEKATESHKYALDWLIEQYQKRLDLSSAVGKREFSDVLIAVIKHIEDSVEQDHYLTKIADLTGVGVEAMRQKMLKTPDKTTLAPLKKVTLPQLDKFEVERVKAQNQILAIVLKNPDLQSFLGPIQPDMLVEEQARGALLYLQKKTKADNNQAPIGDYEQVLLLLYEQLYQDLEIIELRQEAARLQVRLIEYYVKIKKAPLAEAMRVGDEAQVAILLEQVKSLNSLLNSTGR